MLDRDLEPGCERDNPEEYGYIHKCDLPDLEYIAETVDRMRSTLRMLTATKKHFDIEIDLLQSQLGSLCRELKVKEED